ncbi:LOW QUALITY PROTEIN: ATP-binding cassette (ABC) Superfamily [Phytophthora palmivora]|uniref:ATP-binding cassette (ABC) Superfamily n=1 Tax=Phytophthora palmivora TaxID=4796 RepID=A0A2P4YQ51_9STRA|nr:LOW QUALITY PROTEIN: ATP-binding cassette (ABC) Superfamily [Phytophthora palmivora]
MLSMSSRSAIKLLNCKALRCLPRQCILADTIHRMRGLGLLCSWSTLRPLVVLTMGAPRGAYERASVQDEPLFVNDIEAARCVLLAPHRIPLKEFTTSDQGLFPVWGYPWVQPENTTTQTQAEDLFWRWVSLKNLTVQELKELQEDRLLSYVLDQRDLRIEFAHLIAKRQLHSVMELNALMLMYGGEEEGTFSMPRTTYAPAVDPKSQQPSGSQHGAGLPGPTSSVTRGIPATSLAAGASQSAAAPGPPAPHGSGARRSDQGGQEELSHAFEYEAPSQPYPSGPSTSDALSSIFETREEKAFRAPPPLTMEATVRGVS